MFASKHIIISDYMQASGHDVLVHRGRLMLIVTDVRSRFKQVALHEFADNKELIEANMASVHVPFFLDFKPFSWYRYEACWYM